MLFDFARVMHRQFSSLSHKPALPSYFLLKTTVMSINYTVKQQLQAVPLGLPHITKHKLLMYHDKNMIKGLWKNYKHILQAYFLHV